MRYLLDTVTFLRVCGQVELLSAAALNALQDSENTLVLHQASAWEIQIKNTLQKLTLSIPARQFITQAITTHHLHYSTLADSDIWHLEKLPHLHRDPFDRLLIAHASYEGIPIITPDTQIHAYPIRVLW